MQHSMGHPCWIEIPARDIKALQKFYAEAFPNWKWMKSPSQPEDKVMMFRFEGMGNFGGGIVSMPSDCPPSTQTLGSGFTNYFMVPSIDSECERLGKLGAKVVLEKMPESDNGWFANLTDPEGNRFGIYEVNPEKFGSKGCEGQN